MHPQRHPSRPLVLALALPLFVLATTRAAQASFITFETRPDGATPSDNAPLANPYAITGGSVSFYFLDAQGNRVNARFEARGDGDNDDQGFRSTKNGGYDRPDAPGLGNWFLRQPDGLPGGGSVPGPFFIDYDTTETINELSGEIWDIDAAPGGFEQWRVDVLDRQGNVVATQLSPLGIDQDDPNSLDSLPWTFAFTNLTAVSTEVDKVRLTFSSLPGAKTAGIGLAFNNFSAFQAVPEPSSLVLTGLGAAGLLTFATRRRNANARTA